MVFEHDSNFALIVEEGFDYSDVNCSVYSAGATIGNNLNNDNDSILIQDGYNNTLANISYNVLDHPDFQPGKSIHFSNGSSFVGPRSPCGLSSFINTSETKNLTINDTAGTTNITNFTSSTNESQNNCDFALNIESPTFVEDEAIVYDFSIVPKKPSRYTIEYWIEDYFGNIVKDKFITENTNKKRYTPSIQEQYAVYEINAILSTDDCNESDISNNIITQKVSYINELIGQDEKDSETSGKNTATKEKSSMDIIHVYQAKNIKFGEILKVKMDIENDDESSSMSLLVRDKDGKVVSEEYQFNFFRDSSAIFTAEVTLDDSCNESVIAEIVLTGMGMNDKESVLIACPSDLMDKTKSYSVDGMGEDNDPEDITDGKKEAGDGALLSDKSNLTIINNSTKSEVSKFSANTDSTTYLSDTPSIVYQSSSKKAVGIIPYIIFGVCSITVFFIIKGRLRM